MDQVNYWENVMTKRASGEASAPAPTPAPVSTPAPAPSHDDAEPEPAEDSNQAEREAEAKAAAEKAAEDKAAAEKAAADKRAAEEKAAADNAAAEKAAAAQAAAEKEKAAEAKALAAQKLAAAKAIAEKEAAEKAAAEKAAAEKAAAEKAAAAQAARPVPQVQPVEVKPLNQDDFDLNLASERKDAILRIGRPATKQAADLTDPSVIDAYCRIRNDRDPLAWFVLGYAPGSQTKIVVIALGETGFEEMKASLPEDAVYIYINFRFGDTQRSKFIFMTYVPDTLNALKKSRVVGHRPAVEKLLKYMTLQWHVLDKSEMIRETLEKKLLAAGGANYSVQESNKGDFSSYKQATKEFYQETDKATQLTGVVYQQGPLTVTPMDISGRSMVAAQSEFRANTKDLNAK